MYTWYPCIHVYVVSMSYKNTFSASLTDIRQFMTKDTLVALQVPLEVHLQMFSRERSFQTSMAASTHFRWFSSKHSSTLTSLLQLSPHLGQACLKSGYPAPVWVCTRCCWTEARHWERARSITVEVSFILWRSFLVKYSSLHKKTAHQGGENAVLHFTMENAVIVLANGFGEENSNLKYTLTWWKVIWASARSGWRLWNSFNSWKVLSIASSLAFSRGSTELKFWSGWFVLSSSSSLIFFGLPLIFFFAFGSLFSSQSSSESISSESSMNPSYLYPYLLLALFPFAFFLFDFCFKPACSWFSVSPLSKDSSGL